MTTLIMGGTSGLGLELAKQFAAEGDETVVAGRHDPEVEGLVYEKFDLTATYLPQRIGELVVKLPHINTMVYAAGFFQEGRITDLSDSEIQSMFNVGGYGLVHLTRAILNEQFELDELITITSSSQRTARLLEPVYNFVKAGGALFSEAISLDERVGKVMVAAPGGMRTNFWDGQDRDDLDSMMDPTWVASQIMEQRKEDYEFKEISIPRGTNRVDLVSKR